MRVYMQFVAGMTALVEASTRNTVRGSTVVYRDDSAAVFDTSSAVTRASMIPFAKNVFEVIAEVPRRDLTGSVAQLSRGIRWDGRRTTPQGFRLMFHVDGSLVPVGARAKAQLEKAIAARTGGRVQSRGSCQEFWVVGRQDLDRLLLCRRLPKEKQPALPKGALAPELSALLVSASRPRKDEVFLDPFGGSGALVNARLQSPGREFVYSDTALAEYRSALPRALRQDRRVRLLSEDATELRSVRSGAIDVIVTDPPWGEHEDVNGSYGEFADAVADTFDRVLNRSSGRLVLLSSRREAPSFERALQNAALVVGDTHQILVNGHPATVLVAGR